MTSSTLIPLFFLFIHLVAVATGEATKTVNCFGKKSRILGYSSLQSALNSLEGNAPRVAGVSIPKSAASTMISTLMIDGVFYEASMTGMDDINKIYLLHQATIFRLECEIADVIIRRTNICYEDTPVTTADGTNAFIDATSGAFLVSNSRRIACDTQTTANTAASAALLIDKMNLVKTGNRALSLALMRREDLREDASTLFSEEAIESIIDREEHFLDYDFAVVSKFFRKNAARISTAYVAIYVATALVITAVAIRKGVPLIKAAALTLTWAKIFVDYKKYRSEAEEARLAVNNVESGIELEGGQLEDIEAEVGSLVKTVGLLLERIELLEAASCQQTRYGRRALLATEI